MLSTANENCKKAAGAGCPTFVVRRMKPSLDAVPTFVLKPAAPVMTETKIVRKRRPASFERQFLSEKCPEGNGVLEVAVLWRGNVMSVNSFTSINDVVTIGQGRREQKTNIGVEDERVGGRKTLISSYDGRWYLHFERDYDGFLIVDPAKFGVEKVMFSDCRAGSLSGIREVGGSAETLAVAIDGMTRAAIRFGEQLILVRMAKPISEVRQSELRVNAGLASGFAVSILIHIIVFGMMFLATDRADAINIDRILTNARFSEVLIQPSQHEMFNDVEAEVEFEKEEPQFVKLTQEDGGRNVTVSEPHERTDKTKRASSGRTSSFDVASQVGTVNSMLASAIRLDHLDLDWALFDAQVALSARSYGLEMRGAGGLGGEMTRGSRAHSSDAITYIKRTNHYVDLMTSAGRIVSAAKSKSETEVDVKSSRRPNVVGALDARLIYKIVRQHKNELRACYERGLSRDSALSGEVVTRWMVSPDGGVSHVSIASSTMADEGVERCIKNSIERWRFPGAQTDVSTMVTYPFIFEMK